MSEEPPKQTAPPPNEPSASAAHVAQETGDEGTPTHRKLVRAVPSWLVSGVVHAITLLLLAVITGGLPETSVKLNTITVAEAEAEELLEEVEFDLELQQLDEISSLALNIPDPGATAFGDLSLSTELASNAISGSDAPNTTIMDIGALFGKDGLGMTELGPGDGAAMFFGVRTRGRRIVYVVDNSNSMQGGKFETACAELQRSVEQLDEKQNFFVIFFSDMAYPLFYPHTARQMMPATEENKRRLKYWLDTVQRCLKTKGEEAMRLAFLLNPDAIYILGDGAFTDNTVNKVLSLPRLPVTIHTLGFRMKEQAERDLRRIADKFHGTFTEVSVTPEMVALARELERPSNRSPNGAWGITLGQPAKKPAGKKPTKKPGRKKR